MTHAEVLYVGDPVQQREVGGGGGGGKQRVNSYNSH